MAEHREQQHSSTSDPESLKENKPSGVPETVPPDQNTLLPTRAVESEQMRPDKTSQGGTTSQDLVGHRRS